LDFGFRFVLDFSLWSDDVLMRKVASSNLGGPCATLTHQHIMWHRRRRSLAGPTATHLAGDRSQEGGDALGNQLGMRIATHVINSGDFQSQPTK